MEGYLVRQNHFPEGSCHQAGVAERDSLFQIVPTDREPATFFMLLVPDVNREASKRKSVVQVQGLSNGPKDSFESHLTFGATNSTEHSEKQRSEVEGGLLDLVFIGFRTLTLAMVIRQNAFKGYRLNLSPDFYGIVAC